VIGFVLFIEFFAACLFRFSCSVCAATSRGHRKEHKDLLIEWIEYHRLLGVEHIFIYNTYLQESELQPKNKDPKKLAGKTNGGASSKAVKQSGGSRSRRQLLVRGEHSSADELSRSGNRDEASVAEENRKEGEGAVDTDLTYGYYYYGDSESDGDINKKDKKRLSTATDGGSKSVDDDDDDTGDDDTSTIDQLLREYVALGLVTIVPWPYLGCDGSTTVADTTNGFTNRAHSNTSTTTTTNSATGIHRRRLRHNAPLLRRTAQLSCYQRFKETSKWMAMLGVDEFIGVDISQRSVTGTGWFVG
jgi:hypothetical protein